VPEVERRQLSRLRHGIVGQPRRQQLTALVVHGFFIECLRQTLRDTAVHLTGNQQRVEDRAAVVHRDVAPDHHLAGLRVDLYDAHVRPKGKHPFRRRKEVRHFQSRLRPRRQFRPLIRGTSHVFELHGALRAAAHLKARTVDVHVARRCLQQVRRDPDRLFADAV